MICNARAGFGGVVVRVLGGSRQQCGRKRRHRTAEEAMAEASRLRRAAGGRRAAYRCPYCGGFHVGTPGRFTDPFAESATLKTRRAECRACGRLLAIKNKGLCVTCWRKAPKNDRAGRPATLPRATLTVHSADYLLSLETRVRRYAGRIATRFGCNRNEIEDAGSEAVVGAAAAAARWASERVVFLAAKAAVLMAVRDGRLKVGENPYLTAGGNRLWRGRERLRSDMSDVELYGRVIA